MISEQLLDDLGLPLDAEIDAVEQAFMARVKERIQHVAQNYEEAELQKEEEWLRGYLKGFFEFTIEWAAREARKYKDVKEFENAPKLKKEAKTTLTEMQKYIGEFLSCYMHINRFQTLLRDEIQKEEIKVMNAAKIRWTADSGMLMGRYRKEKKEILERMQRFAKARPLLEAVDNDFDTIRDNAVILFGKDKAEPFVRRFNSSVRVLDFKKAQRSIEGLGEAKKKFGLDKKTAQTSMEAIEHSAGRIMTLAEKEQKTLEGEENKILLRPAEVDVAINSDIKELQKIKAFLAKYHLPYMQYKLNNLKHLKEKLLVMDSPDNLVGLYKRLIMGIALPLKDIKTTRLYESEILNHVKYLLGSHFTEIPTILQRAEETVREFRDNRSELEEFERMNLQEVTPKEDQVAQA